MTIEEIRQAKAETEQRVQELLQRLVNESGMHLADVLVDWNVGTAIGQQQVQYVARVRIEMKMP